MRTFLLCLLIIVFQGAVAEERYHVNSILLMQPEAVFQQRTGDVAALGNYVDALGTTADVALLQETRQVPASGFIVVAVRPGGFSRVWLDFTPALSTDLAARLQGSLAKVVPMPTKDGVVVFAIKVSFWGAEQTPRRGPTPAEWKKATKGTQGPIEIGALMDRVWPAEPPGH